MIKLLCIILFAALTVGCGKRWDSAGPPNIRGTNTMTGVSNFIATNGWNMCTNDDDLGNWDKLTPQKIGGLPWTKYKGREFWAVTCHGVLYVLSAPGWHGDYSGVAFNPMTNRFPASVDGFEPVGDHWYVWCRLEFAPTGMTQKYEK